MPTVASLKAYLDKLDDDLPVVCRAEDVTEPTEFLALDSLTDNDIEVDWSVRLNALRDDGKWSDTDFIMLLLEFVRDNHHEDALLAMLTQHLRSQQEFAANSKRHPFTPQPGTYAGPYCNICGLLASNERHYSAIRSTH